MVIFVFTSKEKQVFEKMLTYQVQVIEAIEAAFSLPKDMVVVKDSDPETGVVLVGPQHTNEGARPVPPQLNGSGWALVDGKLINPLPSGPIHEEREVNDIKVSDFPNPYTAYSGLPAEFSAVDSWYEVVFDNSDGRKEIFQTPMVDVTVGFEGFHFQVAKYRGKIFVYNRNKLDATRTVYGTAKMATALEHLNFSNWFDESSESSSGYFGLMATMQGNITASRVPFGKDGLDLQMLYAGNNGLPFPKENVVEIGDMDFYTFPHGDESLPMKVDDVVPLHRPVRVPLSEVNDFLRNGIGAETPNQDPRFNTGESLMVKVQTINIIGGVPSQVTRLFKLSHPSFNWRNSVRGSDPSARHRFSVLMAQKPLAPKVFAKTFLEFTPPELQNVKDLLASGAGFFYVPESKFTPTEWREIIPPTWDKFPVQRWKEIVERYKMYKYYVFINFLYSLPIHEQREAVMWWDAYLEERKNFINYLQSLRVGKLQFVDPSTLPRISFDGEIPSPLPKEIQKGMSRLYYNVSGVERIPRMDLVLLKEPHPFALKMLHWSEKFLRNPKNRVKNESKYAEFERSFNFHLDNTLPENYYHQLVRQTTAWERSTVKNV